MISDHQIEQAASQIMANAAIDIPEDYRRGVEDMAKWEQGELSCFVLQTKIDQAFVKAVTHCSPAIL